MANGQKKRPLSMMTVEPQFDFQSEEPLWRQKQQHKQQQQQNVFGSNFVRHYPVEPVPGHPKVVEFQFLDLDQVWAMGPNTRFVVSGQFQVSKPPPEGQMPEWEPCTEDELDKVVVQPNFFESMIRKIDFFHGYSPINYSSEVPGVSSFLNAWKYNYMDKKQKQKLCPEETSPGFGVPSKVNGWDMNEPTSEWRKDYGPKIFCGKKIQFDHVFLDLPPFFQGNNYLEEPPKILPMPLLDKLMFRIYFKDDLGCIFKNKAGNESKYRFYFNNLYLVAEHLRLNPALMSTLMNKKGIFPYRGVTRISKMEHIPEKSMSYKSKIQGVYFPEGMFIFALPKAVVSPNETFTYADSDSNVFLQHNIKELQFTFGGHSFFLDTISLGEINDDVIDKKLFFDYLTAPPFGMKMDPNKITMANMQNGGKDSAYPHVYVNFCNYGNKSRILPIVSDINMKEERELEVKFTFNAKGAAPDAVYIIYYFYTDTNIILNMPKNTSRTYWTSSYLGPG
jgi:hypothetical protein